MKSIKGYVLQEHIINFNSSDVGFQKAEKELDGEEVEVLWIKKTDIKTATTVNRILKNIKSLPGLSLPATSIVGIQRIIEIDEDEENNCSFIVYEAIQINESEFNKQDLEQIIDTLDDLKKTIKLQGFLLDENTVVKNHENGARIRFVGLFDLFRKEIIPYENVGADKRKTENDIVAVSDLFKEYLFSSDIGTDIYNVCQSEQYEKYTELKEEIDRLPNEKNPEWNSISVVVNDEKNENIDQLINELNSGCWWRTIGKLSEKGDVQVEWSTKNWNSIFFVNEMSDENGQSYGQLFVPHINFQPKDKIIAYGERAKFNFINGMYQNEFYPIPNFLTQRSVNALAKLNERKKSSLQRWKTLPQNEKKHIEQQAFKASYSGRFLSKENNTNIVFTLEDSFADWEKVKNKKNEEVVLHINDFRIGEILDYKKNEKSSIVIKDFNGVLDGIPEKGELVENVYQQTSQYKKQIEACENFGNRNIINPDLAAFIATPEETPPPIHLEIDYDGFEDKIIDKLLKQDETQKNAVIDALHREPVFLIQGPPGTGKTTVIVEMIQQFINRKKDIKILVASQSNTAVDNVLERLPEKIKFMRLASENAVTANKISSKISKHTFDTKLQGWSNETAQSAQENLKSRFPNIDWPLADLYKEFKRNPKISFEKFKKLYRRLGGKDYYEKTFQNTQNIKQVEELFNEKLGSQFINLQQIHSEWLAFVRNATSKKGAESISKIKNGSEDIGLDIAFTKSMNVLSATCIHVASSKYASIDLKFDVMIMDESSKATNAEAIVPINMSKKIVLIGDHKQLPPVVPRDKDVRKGITEDLEDEGLDIDKVYGESMFERLIAKFESENRYANLFTMLDIQYRMPRQIGHLISKFIYDGKLKNPSLPDYDNGKSHNIPLKTSTVSIGEEQVPNSIVVISTSKSENPYDNDEKTKRSNPTNIKVIKNTLKQIQMLYKDNNEIPIEIGIIAAYRGQVEMLKSSIHKKEYMDLKIDINTVDQFQGSEKDIIIYDLVRSSSGRSSIGFLDDYRRINVAFSRAKKLLLVVGDSDYVLKRVQCNSDSDIKNREDLHLVKIFKQLEDWDCVYPSFEEALDYDG